MSDDNERYSGEYRPRNEDLALLGMVVSEWSEVEFWLHVILRRLAGIDFDASRAIFGNIRNWRTITDALRALAAQKMDDKDAKVFERLLDRFDRQAKRRNGIVHASWYKNQDADEWCRYLVPSRIDQISEILSRDDPASQKIRARHLFRPSDMQDFCATAQTLQDDIVRFWDDWRHRQSPA